MCLAIPAKIESIQDDIAQCRVGDSDTHIQTSLMLIDHACEIGDWVIIHAGFALRRLDEEEAQETLRILRQMVALHQENEVQF